MTGGWDAVAWWRREVACSSPLAGCEEGGRRRSKGRQGRRGNAGLTGGRGETTAPRWGKEEARRRCGGAREELRWELMGKVTVEERRWHAGELVRPRRRPEIERVRGRGSK